ncbi:MAG: T9SS type A sorting domain-containing protein [Flavipsychrobacter sp.]|nr:T9SS type A sorting domain-containing protein [Flavipsychrobacter sp.]
MSRAWLYIMAVCVLPVLQARGQNVITTIAGDGITQYIGDGTPATIFSLAHPEGIYVDNALNVYVADNYNQRIRKITPGGTISTLLGNGTTGYTGDGGLASAATMNKPNGIVLDTAGNMFITEWYNSVVRRVDASTSIITTVAGTGTSGYSGDGGPATSAQLGTPGGVCLDRDNNIYIPDYANHRIRKVNATTGIITTIAGTGTNGYTGDGGPATAATISYPVSICRDLWGNLLWAEYGNNVIRKLNLTTGIISTIAGTGVNGYSGDNGPATAATLGQPNGVFADAAGVVYISEDGNNVIRAVNIAGIIKTIVGTGAYAYTGDGGPATAATIYNPYGVFVDNIGNLYIADAGNSVIRKVTNPMGATNIHLARQPFIVAPNPSAGTFSITLPHHCSYVEIAVTDVCGRLTYKEATSGKHFQIDLNNNTTGIYFVHVHTKDGSDTRKLFIAR